MSNSSERTIPAERAIFLKAIDKDDPADRMAYLDAACGNDASLRASVEALLAAHEQSASMLDQPIGSGPIRSGLSDEFAQQLNQQALDHIGMRIGPYRLMEQIGEGGFGLVFVAEQEHPVRRRVALKIVKPGAASKEVIARFESERQALALMNHPNIAQVFDAGVTADHRPYFVMELVRGLPITEFCDKNRMDLRKRLNLMIDVCSAVHHAHQKGVIHRDIKPSNVMVTLHDGKPVAKVIDFGVAKAIGQRLTDKTVYTRFFSMIGTPMYMSPEQAEMSGVDVDTRTDIYSLGVLLYELLAGTTPFDRSRMDSVGLDEMRRIIREEEPPRPSTRLSTQRQRLSTIADQRRLDEHRLVSTLKGDLDWIVMKALDKDRSRRYDSAASLADDIHRYLADAPITARPPSAWYQFQKFARRHRVGIITAAIVGCTMIAGTSASLWQMSKAIKAQHKLKQFADNLTQASVLVANGQSHADAGRLNEAVRDYNAAVEIMPTYFLPRVQRAELFARVYLWPEAAEDFALALNTGASTSHPQWRGVPALLRYTQHDEPLTRLLQQYQNQLQTDAEKPRWSILRGLVVGNAVATSEEDGLPANWTMYAELAQKWLSQMPHRPPRPFGDPPLGRPSRGPLPAGRPRNQPGDRLSAEPLPPEMCYYVTALANLRAGKCDLAIKLLNEAQDFGHWPDQYLSHAPLALAYHHIGESKASQLELQRSTDSLRDILDDLSERLLENRSVQWSDLAEALLIHDEASRAILGTPSQLKPAVAKLRTVSLGLISQ